MQLAAIKAEVQKLKRKAVERHAHLMRCLDIFTDAENRLPLEPIHDHVGYSPQDPLGYEGSIRLKGGPDDDLDEMIMCTFALHLGHVGFEAVASDEAEDADDLDDEEDVPSVTCEVTIWMGKLESSVRVTFGQSGWLLVSDDDENAEDVYYRRLLDVFHLDPGEERHMTEEEGVAAMTALSDFYLALMDEVDERASS